jgi:AraC-like DNA-binding protein
MTDPDTNLTTHWRRVFILPRRAKIIVIRANTDIRHKSQDEWRLLCQLTGNTAVITSQQQRDLQQHDCLFIAPGTPWLRQSETGGTLALFEFRFDWHGHADPLLKLQTARPIRSTEACLAATSAAQRYHKWHPRAGAGQIFLRSELDHILSSIVHAGEQQHAFINEGKVTPPIVTAFLDDLFHRARRVDWRIAILAKHLGVSPEHLARLCRQHLNRTPQNILQEKRVRVAVDLLRSGAVERVDDAAERVGYDRSQLWRYCLKHTGQSPAEFIP